MGINILGFAICIVLGYLLGSFNTAIVICKLMDKGDVRAHGSGNAGMTNMLRTYGKVPAALTLLGDFFKGAIAIWFGRYLYSLLVADVTDYQLLCVSYAIAIAALLGHTFPVFFGFKGGKGILVTAGVILALNPMVLVILLAIFLIFTLSTRIVSVGSIVVAIAYPIVTFVIKMSSDILSLTTETIACALMAILVLFMHRENIKRLIDGTENKFGSKK